MVKSVIRTSFAAALVALVVTPAVAKGDAAKAAEKRFAKMDTNSDGKVALDEYSKFRTDLAASQSKPAPTEKQLTNGFKRLDLNGDGSITLEEVKQVDAAKAKADAAAGGAGE